MLHVLCFNKSMEYYRLILYAIFGVLPSLIWLFYYLTKDTHPEPKKIILKIFLLGGVAALVALAIEIEFANLLYQTAIFNNYPILFNIIESFFVVALVEESLKYTAASRYFFNGAMDEPLDIMLYLTISALGFAAVENMCYLLLLYNNPFAFQATIFVSLVRFVGGTLLHALCSATLGYFLVISFFETKKRVLFTIAGLCIATLLHGFYDFTIMTVSEPFSIVIPFGILLILLIFVTYTFDSIKKMKSISKI